MVDSAYNSFASTIVGTSTTYGQVEKKPKLSERDPRGLIPVFSGAVRLRGMPIWTSPKIVKAKGNTYDVVIDIAVLFARNAFDRPVKLLRLFIDGEDVTAPSRVDPQQQQLLQWFTRNFGGGTGRFGNDTSFRHWFYDGSDASQARARIIQEKQSGQIPAWRGYCYAVIRGVSLKTHDYKIPRIEAVLSSYSEDTAEDTDFITPIATAIGEVPIIDYASDWVNRRLFYLRGDDSVTYSYFSTAYACAASLDTRLEYTAYPIQSTIGDLQFDELEHVPGTTLVVIPSYDEATPTAYWAVVDFSSGQMLSAFEIEGLESYSVATGGNIYFVSSEDSHPTERLFFWGKSVLVWSLYSVNIYTGRITAKQVDYSLTTGSSGLTNWRVGVSPNGFPCLYTVRDTGVTGARMKLIYLEWNGAELRDFEGTLAPDDWNDGDSRNLRMAAIDQSENRLLVTYVKVGSGETIGHYVIVDLATGEVVYRGTLPTWDNGIGREKSEQYARGYIDIYSDDGSDWHRLIDVGTGEVVATDLETYAWFLDSSQGLAYRKATNAGQYTFEVKTFAGATDQVRSIADLLADLAVFGGYDAEKISSEGLDGIQAYGWVLNSDEVNVLDTLREICALYGILMVESGDGLKFIKAATDGSYAVDETVAEDDLVDEGQGPVARAQRRAELDLPGTVTVEYLSRQSNSIKTTSAKRPGSTTITQATQSYSVPLRLADDGAADLAYERLFAATSESVDISFVLPDNLAKIEPGDILTLTLDDLSVDVQVMQTDYRDDLTIQCSGRTLLEVRDMQSGGVGIPGPGDQGVGGYYNTPRQNFILPLIAATGGAFEPTFSGGNPTQTITLPLIAATGGPFTPAFSQSGGSDPDFANVLLLCGFEGSDGSTSFTDESSNGWALSALGNGQIDTAQFKYGASSFLSDGTGDGITIPFASSLCNFAPSAATPWTIEFWAYLDTTVWVHTFLGCYDDVTAERSFLFQALSDGRLRFYSYGTASPLTITTATGMPTAGVWQHYSVDHDSTGKTRIFLNGQMKASSLATVEIDGAVSTPFRIGAYGAGSAIESLKGQMDELRITVGAAESRYPSDLDFTPPAAAFPRS